MPDPRKFPDNRNSPHHVTPAAQIAALRKRVSELEQDVAHYEKLIGTLAKVLTDTARAIAPNDPTPDWNNLPDQAEELRLKFVYKDDL